MVNRSNDKYVKKESYFIRSSDTKIIQRFRFNKRSLNKLFNTSKKDISNIGLFIQSNNLSYKDEEDVISILEYAFGK